MARKKDSIEIIIADDHRVFAEALRIAVDLETDIDVVGVAADGEEAVRLAEEKHPDVVVIDAEMPGMDGIQATKQIKRAHPGTRVVVLTGRESDLVVARAVEAGASGTISKGNPLADVSQAIRMAHAGEALIDQDEIVRILHQLRRRRAGDASGRERVERLTRRETEILQLMADGYNPEQISTQLGMSPHTLRTHVQNVLTKLGVHSKMEALAYAIRYGKVRPTPT